MQHPKRFSALSAAVGTAALAIALVIVPASSASADTGTIDGVTYTTSGTTATATAYSGSSATVVIPSTVTISSTVYTVVGIDNSAFDADAVDGGHNTFGPLTSVTLPSTLQTIGVNGFARNHLTSIDIPDSVTDLEGAAFISNDISSIHFPSGITTIAASVFFGNQLTSLVLPSTVTTVGDYGFSDNPITSLTLDSALVTIGASAFQSEAYTTVTIPASVTSIGDFAFNTSTVTTAHFLGPKPTVGEHLFGDYGLPTVYYYWRYGDPQTAGGYTTPTWLANLADAAEGGPYPTQPVAIIHFAGNGGSTPTDRVTNVGNPVSAPTSSTRSGYTFTGWFTAATGGTKWNFADPVTGDLTLFAHWSTAGLALTGIDPLPVLPVGVGALALGLVFWIVARRRERGARA